MHSIRVAQLTLIIKHENHNNKTCPSHHCVYTEEARKLDNTLVLSENQTSCEKMNADFKAWVNKDGSQEMAAMITQRH